MRMWRVMVRCGRCERLLQNTTVHLLSWFIRGLLATLRPVYVQEHVVHDAAQSGRPFLLALWHGRMFSLFPLYRRYRVLALVSRSKDGEFISQVLGLLGIAVVRGSSSRGGARGLRALIKQVREGYVVVVTPDGPRGPLYTVQPGIVAIAAKTGATIVPVTYSACWKKSLHTWDHFHIPLPFSRVVVIYGEPIAVPEGEAARGLHTKCQELEMSLRGITGMADSYFARVSAE